MGVKTRIQPINRDVQLFIDELLSPSARSKQFAAMAQDYLDDADNINSRALGHIPKNQTYVDGRQGAPITSVRPDGGVVVREYEMIFEVLLFISDTLHTLSPIGHGPDKRPGHPGFYRASHVLFADGEEVNFNGPMTIGQLPDASEYVFLSDAPYARRIEKRSTIYEMTAAKASSRFGNVANARFGWQSPLLSYVSGGSNRVERAAQRIQPAKQSAKHIERSSRVPAIIVTIGR